MNKTSIKTTALSFKRGFSFPFEFKIPTAHYFHWKNKIISCNGSLAFSFLFVLCNSSCSNANSAHKKLWQASFSKPYHLSCLSCIAVISWTEPCELNKTNILIMDQCVQRSYSTIRLATCKQEKMHESGAHSNTMCLFLFGETNIRDFVYQKVSESVRYN